ncbi:amylovoran biosynthesis protein AmsE, partial [Klebsiella pneumoniae subsp. pneumoniae]
LEDILVEARVGKHTLERRRGWKYIKSELALMRLKNEFNITNKIEGGGIFLIRVLSRILPISILNFLYSKDRVKIS